MQTPATLRNTSDMPQRIVALTQRYDRMTREEREGAEGAAIRETLYTVGRTAAFFGGYAGMIALHDAAESLVGNNNSVGYVLNWMWDGIGGWMA